MPEGGVLTIALDNVALDARLRLRTSMSKPETT